MALVAYADGTQKDQSLTNETAEYVWVSPATMDSNDTVVLPTRTGKTPYIISAFDNTTGDSVTASISTQTVTVDAAGGTTDHVYVIKYIYA